MFGVADDWHMYGGGISFDLDNKLILNDSFFFLRVEADVDVDSFFSRDFLIGVLDREVRFARLYDLELSW